MERYLDHPECYYNRTCRPINITNQVPMEWAIPLYGYWMPVIVSLTVATNSFIVIVLSHKYLRTPTNYVLLAMAVSELFTGISCIPWFIYYFTLEGHKAEEIYGLPSFWCIISPYVAAIFPSIFHSTAIWLTVYLAIQRYVYICVPTLVQRFCTISRSKQVTGVICFFSFIIYSPELFANYQFSKVVFDTKRNASRRNCYRMRTEMLRSVGDFYYKALYSGQCTLVHLVPCILLVIFTWKLVHAIRMADKRHAGLLNKSIKRKVTECTGTDDSSTNRLSRLLKPRESVSEPKRVQGLKQNTRMLVVVIIIFLVTEIPAALIFIIHVVSVSMRVNIIDYKLLNILLIFRNVLIVSTYPFRFAIYCGMSQQFRDVVHQMFTGRLLRHLIKDKDNSTTLALVHGTQIERDSDEKRHSMLVVSSNGRSRSSLTPSTEGPPRKTIDKAVQCDAIDNSNSLPFDPYLSDLSVLVGESSWEVSEGAISGVSTQCDTKLDTMFVNRKGSLLRTALKEQTIATCKVMLTNAN